MQKRHEYSVKERKRKISERKSHMNGNILMRKFWLKVMILRNNRIEQFQLHKIYLLFFDENCVNEFLEGWVNFLNIEATSLIAN